MDPQSLSDDEHYQMIERRLQNCEQEFWECVKKVTLIKKQKQNANNLMNKVLDDILDQKVDEAQKSNDEE